MRFLEFKTLLEYDRSKTEELLGNSIAKVAQRDTYLRSRNLPDPQLVDAVIVRAEESDPTQNKQYVVWILRQFIKKSMKFEDMIKLRDDLETFVTTKGQHKRLGINSDINQYDWRSIVDVARKLSNTELADPESEATGPIEGAKVLYDGPLGTLTVPETEEASCQLGSGTRWCTAARNRNMFNHYNQQGPLYIWNDKKLKEKFQFHFESFQFMDAQDSPIEADQLTYFAFEHPIIKKLFASKKEAIATGFSEYVGYLEDHRDYNDNPDEWEEEYGEPPAVNQQFDELEPQTMFQLIGKENLNQHMKSIRSIPQLAYSYALGIVRGPWPPGERAIKEDPWFTVAYAKNVIKGRWPEIENHLARTAATDNYYRAIDYAVNVIKGRWPEAEQFGLRNSGFMREYAQQVIKGRWPEAESRINIQNWDYIDRYNVMKYLEIFNLSVDDLNMSDESKAVLKSKIQDRQNKTGAGQT